MIKNKKLILQIILTAIAYLLAFPPFSLGFLMPIVFASLLDLTISAKNSKSAFKRVLVFGIISQTALLYWMTNLMRGGLVGILIFSLLLLILYQSLYFALMSVFIKKLSKLSVLIALVLFPFINVAQEKIHELGQISFPWLSSGYAYGAYSLLIQAASSWGVYFYSFIISVSAVLLYLAFNYLKNRSYKNYSLGFIVLIHLLLITYGYFRINNNLDYVSSNNSVKISLIQGNVDQNVKWDYKFVNSVIDKQADLSKTTLIEEPDLVVWSESALPFYFYRRTRYKNKALKFFKEANTAFLFGTLNLRKSRIEGRKFEYFNSAMFYKPNKLKLEESSKIKLVPFAEKLPFEDLFPIISKVDLGEADFSPGDERKLFNLNNKKFFVPICYEVVYPEHIRKFVEKGADYMVAITNDGWFGRSGMPYQHSNISKFRCIENGISAARCANSGISIFYDCFGRSYQETDLFISKAITARISTNRIKTFYTKYGDVFGWLSLWVMIASVCGYIYYIYQKNFIKK